jgi:hypothetical protein
MASQKDAGVSEWAGRVRWEDVIPRLLVLANRWISVSGGGRDDLAAADYVNEALLRVFDGRRRIPVKYAEEPLPFLAGVVKSLISHAHERARLWPRPLEFPDQIADGKNLEHEVLSRIESGEGTVLEDRGADPLLRSDTVAPLDVDPLVPMYIAPPLLLEAGQLFSESNENLISALAHEPKGLYELAPRKFEEIIADIFWKAGYEVELTGQTRDGGRDIVAVSRRMGIPLRLLIECKRYSPANKVTLALVQRLFGVKIAEAASKAILATTSTFSRDAWKFASAHMWDLDLKDYDAVVGWLRAYSNPTA